MAHLQSFIGPEFNRTSDCMAVRRSCRKRLKYQQVQCALQEFELACSSSSRHSTGIYDAFRSNVNRNRKRRSKLGLLQRKKVSSQNLSFPARYLRRDGCKNKKPRPMCSWPGDTTAIGSAPAHCRLQSSATASIHSASQWTA